MKNRVLQATVPKNAGKKGSLLLDFSNVQLINGLGLTYS